MADAKPVSPQRLRALLASATVLPWWWVTALVVVAVGSTVDISMPAKGATSWHIAVGPTTLVAIGLIWLPSAIRLLALAGGSVKAGGWEASSTGLMQAPEQLIEDLTELRTTAEPPPGERGTVQGDVDRIAARYLPPEQTLTPEVVNRLAREYEAIRRRMRGGDKRTAAMNRLVNEVRIRAAAAPETARAMAPALLRSSADGDRIVGLALVQGTPAASVHEDVLRIVGTAASAFEQYHALRALDKMLPVLDADERARTKAVLEREKTDPRGIGVMKDAPIASWIDHLLVVLSDPAAGR
ncbi:hypothetical protein [Labedaea rhizosphaerae]|uniref:Uncharacterized protein n=1 Tax=Labedaea rhizosphaerae TaxID=598644 RepID=A0A4R6S8P8_LABRH|nr:hypothetical protein [Labedaea rhizosphaerae]TDP96349.1 hypothetical protein EV186_104334 [Labedaea rhizosphaerae]